MEHPLVQVSDSTLQGRGDTGHWAIAHVDCIKASLCLGSNPCTIEVSCLRKPTQREYRRSLEQH